MPDDSGAKDGWLNRHSPVNGLFSSRESGHNWRLVHAQLREGVLRLWAVPSLAIRAFDPAAIPPADATFSQGTTLASVDSAPGPPTAQLAALALEPDHLSATVPHPELVVDHQGLLNGGTPVSLAHYLLFLPAASEDVAATAAAIPFASDLLATLQAARAYVDLTASSAVTHAVPSDVLNRAALIVHTLLDYYPSIILNGNVHQALQQFAESLCRLDDSAATALKLDIYKRFEAATEAAAIPTPLPPAPGEGLAIKMQQQLRPYLSQLWIPPDLFLDAEFFDHLAPQISLFHQHFWTRWAPTSDVSLLFHGSGDKNISEWRMNPLVFDLTSPHFLGALLLNHALAPQLDSAQRGALFSQWIILGTTLRELGDIVGWVAIAAVMCQVPVLRLRDAWAHVDVELRARVSREWGFEVFELEKRAVIDILEKTTFRASSEEMGEKYPKDRCVPYFGDIIVESSAHSEQPSLLHVKYQIERMRAVIDGWYYYYDQSPDMPNPPPLPTVMPHYQDLFNTWLRLNATLPNPLQSATQGSLAIEPRAFGNYLNFHSSQQLPLSSGSFVPILFTEVNPGFRLLPKAALVTSSGVVSSSSSKRSLRGLNFSGSSNAVSISAPSPTRSLHRSSSFPPLNQPLATGVREVELGTREYMTKHTSGHALVRNIRDLFNVGVTTHLVGLDIVLKSIDDDHSQSSRTSSIIENLGPRSIMDNRRHSVQSLELASRIETHNTLTVVVKAASLTRLVDILVLGVGEFSAQGSAQRFKINLPVHTETFLATFRSFCSPSDLLRMLEHRFDGAPGAAVSIVQHRNGHMTDPNEPFPKWHALLDMPSGQAFRVVNQIYLNILEALQFWVSEYYFDFADDEALRNTTHRFLKHIETVLTNPQFSEALQSQAKRLVGSFVKQRYKVADVPHPTGLPPLSRHMVHILPQPGEDSLPSLEQYIEDLDSIVANQFNLVTLRDWMQLFENLELQVSDADSLFKYSAPRVVTEDDLPIQDIFSYFTTLYRSNPDDKLLSHLPSCISGLFKLHNNIADYIAYQITDPMIHVVKRSRVSRMTYVLKLLGILKTRMRYFDLFPDADESETRVPSFLESAIVSGILRPESRSFAVAWLQAGREVAAEFGYNANAPMGGSSVGFQLHEKDVLGPPNSQTLFIPNIPAELLNANGAGIRPITPDIGWVVERLLEIVSYVPNMSVDNSELINFDKRRYSYNLVKNIQSEFAQKPTPSSDINRLYARYDYLVNPDPSMYKLDRRGIKDSLVRETQGLPKAQLRLRVFAGAVAAEQEKLKLETRQLEVLASRQVLSGISASTSTSNLALRERKSTRTVRPTSTLIGTPPSSSSGSISSDRERKGKSRFGAGLLKAVRPLSMAFSSTGPTSFQESGSALGYVHPYMLPLLSSVDEGGQKLVLTIDLADFEIKGPRSNGIFRLVRPGQSQQSHDLQATSDQDAQEWINALESARRVAIARSQAKPGSTRVFGVPIEIVCEREKNMIPHMVTTLLEQVEQRGLDEVGLYRISGSLAAVNTLKGAFDNGEILRANDTRWLDINAVAGCVKLYLRELPEPLLTNALFGEFVACSNIRPQDKQLEALKLSINRLPTANYNLLKRLIEHLNLVVEHEATNKMSTPNLAIVFSMNFLPPNAMDQMRAMQSIINTMIVNQRVLFSNSNGEKVVSRLSTPYKEPTAFNSGPEFTAGI